jgi:hypothetical protein
MTDERHRHDHQPPASVSTLGPALFPLWVLQKDADVRAAALYAHPLGHEIRVVDRAGELVRTEVARGGEADATQRAAALEDVYTSDGWTKLG